jgi:LPS export ABC transporter protein LptC
MLKKVFFSLFFALCSLLFALCSFDYGNTGGGDKSLPDIVMDNVEYVRVRSLDPQARLQAERVERYEERGIMELRNFSFEQFGNHGDDINAYGRAGSASFEIDSGNIQMEDGVRIDVDSEEIALETSRLEWKDKERTLSGGTGEEVHVYQENGTSFIGVGFQANARSRTWSFTDTVSGIYIYDDEDEEDPENSEEAGIEEISSEETSPEPKPDDNDSENTEGI